MERDVDLLFRVVIERPDFLAGQYTRHIFEKAYKNNPEYELCRVATMLEF